MTVTLNKINSDHYADFLEKVIDEFAETLVQAKLFTDISKALVHSKEGICTTLSNKADTSNHIVQEIIANDQPVGYLWYSINNEKSADNLQQSDSMLWWIYIHKDHRRKGYAHETLDKMEEQLKLLKQESIELSVFSENKVALSLYEKCGYKTFSVSSEAAFCTLSKPIFNRVSPRP